MTYPGGRPRSSISVASSSLLGSISCARAKAAAASSLRPASEYARPRPSQASASPGLCLVANSNQVIASSARPWASTDSARPFWASALRGDTPSASRKLCSAATASPASRLASPAATAASSTATAAVTATPAGATAIAGSTCTGTEARTVAPSRISQVVASEGNSPTTCRPVVPSASVAEVASTGAPSPVPATRLSSAPSTGFPKRSRTETRTSGAASPERRARVGGSTVASAGTSATVVTVIRVGPWSSVPTADTV